MRRVATTALLVVILGGATLVGSVAADGHRLHRSCGPAEAKTLRRDRGARIYELPAEPHRLGTPTFGCLFATRHSWRLDRPSRWSYLNLKTLVLGAPWVAYSITSMGVDGGASGVSVRNLRNGVISHSFPAVTSPSAPMVESFSSVAKIVLQKDGDIAWVGEESSIPNPQLRRQVEIAHSAGLSVVDEGPGIAPESLTLNGSTVSWVDSGETRTAQLP